MTKQFVLFLCGAITAILSGCDVGRVGASVSNFPVQPETNGESLAALMGGTLTLTDGCLRVQAEEYPAEKGYLVIWPAGFTYAETSAGLTVYNADRERVAAVGEAVTLGGGEVSRSYEVEFEENARQVLTEACSGPYWLAGTVE